jgi:hypothetical protein
MAEEKEEIVAEEDFKDLVPQMNVMPPATTQEQVPCLIEDEALLGIYNEILGNFRDDRKQAGELAENFAEMVVNGGDSSTSSKEALVNLLKLKNDTSDRMSKIADLMTRIKLKSPDTYKPYLNAKQENKTTINIGGNRRKLIKKIEEATAKRAAKENDE